MLKELKTGLMLLVFAHGLWKLMCSVADPQALMKDV